MSELTLTTPVGGYRHDPEYAAGRADAYDDSHTRTLDELIAIGAQYVDHAHLLRALGYCDRITELRMERETVAAAETELAHTDTKAAQR
ncbi:hypothetical protein ACF06X_33545 [Streptomyces sp. NPDC015346]|uniref:hypothetical protein n=1 Tax=Streptomyces sp. NPDC015346 TaxID=3364954 RepID=UPI003702B1FE